MYKLKSIRLAQKVLPEEAANRIKHRPAQIRRTAIIASTGDKEAGTIHRFNDFVIMCSLVVDTMLEFPPTCE
jgi:hypothetical protein